MDGMEGEILFIEQCIFYMSSVAFLGFAPKSLAAGGAYIAPQIP